MRRLSLQRLNERVACFFVIYVELTRDVLLLVRTFLEQRGGAPEEEILCADKEPKPLVLVWVVELPEVPRFKNLAAMAEGVKPDSHAVRHKNPFGPRRIDCIFPRLLNRALVPARHNGIEVECVRAFQFERRKNLPLLV
jgi:hypothetical protein